MSCLSRVYRGTRKTNTRQRIVDTQSNDDIQLPGLQIVRDRSPEQQGIRKCDSSDAKYLVTKPWTSHTGL